MAMKGASRRLTKEYMAIQKSPPPFIIARPLETNILEWHYVIRGPPDTPYEAGEYHGKLVFPADYPFKPPSIRMTTPSGRFQPDTRLCLTMSDFHPSSWNPSWSVATILNGLLSFMAADEATTGSIKTTDTEKRILAARSHKFNLANPKFRDVFPELCTPEPAPLPQLNSGTAVSMPASVIPAPPVQPSTLIRRPAGMTAVAAAAAAVAEARVEANAPANGAVVPRNNNMFAWTFGQWRKWLLVFVVCVYLLAAKLIARSSGNMSGSL